MSQEQKLSATDIVLMEQIIRAGQTRGAFKAEEMSEVGTLYNKLKAMVESFKEQQRLQEEERKKLEPIEEGNDEDEDERKE